MLDPIFSLRRRIRLLPGTTVRVTFSTLVAPSREAALDLADKYRDPAVFERAATMAWTQAQVHLRHLGIPADEANLFQRLANRLLFAERVSQALERDRENVSVIFIDIDDFKTINDTLGHAAGDELLIAISRRLRDCVRPSDTLARLGGDEFAIML